MGRMWIGKPYLTKRIKDLVAQSEFLKIISEKNEIKNGIDYSNGKIDAYNNILEILKEDD